MLMSSYIFDQMIIILCLCAFIGYIIYIIISNHRNKTLLIDKEHVLRKNKKLLKIDLRDEKVSLYLENARKLDFTYTFQQFESLLDYKSLPIWSEFIEKVLTENHAGQKISVSLTMMDRKTTIKNVVKVVLLNYLIESETIYASVEEIDNSLQFESQDNIFDYKIFIDKINELSGTMKASINGLVLAVKVTNMDFLRKRYGKENANKLYYEVTKKVSQVAKSEDIYATYLNNNVFCFFIKGVNKKSESKEIVNKIYNQIIATQVEVLDQKITPSIHINYTIYGDKSYDLKDTITLVAKSQNKGKIYFIEQGVSSDTNEIYSDKQKIRELISTSDFKVLFEPIINLEQINTIGYYLYSRFQVNSDSDGFVTVYNLAERYGLKQDFLDMYYKKVFDTCLANSKRDPRFFLKIDLGSLDSIKRKWPENEKYQKIKLYLVINYEEIIHPKKTLNFKSLFQEFNKLGIKFAIIADENMLTIISNTIPEVDYIILDEYMTSGIESNDMKNISIENIISNTTSNKIKYIGLGIKKHEQAEVLLDLGVENIAGSYLQIPMESIENEDYLKNRNLLLISRSQMND